MRASLFFLSGRMLSSIHMYHQFMSDVLLPCVQSDDSADEALDDEVWALLCVLDAYVVSRISEL